MDLPIPPTLVDEHKILWGLLGQAKWAGGDVAILAKNLIKLLHEHFERENRLVMPLLSFLPALASKDLISPSEDALAVAVHVRDVMPQMLQEHQTAKDILRDFKRCASEALKPGHADFADMFVHHMQLEEEIIYPAAIVVADLICALRKTH